MTTEISVPSIPEAEPRTAMDIRAQVNRIQEVMQSVMKNGVHYGTIPGCGEKPSLLKPGAEKLMMTFRMAVDPLVEDRSDETTCRYRVLAKLTYIPTGQFIGQGLGECSSDEEKYAWRRAAIEHEWFDADPADRREKWRRGKGGTTYKEKQIRTHPADVANTVLKMAKKRALIDAVLTVTAASDIFSQDIEEIEEPPTEVSTDHTSLKDKLKEQVKQAIDTGLGEGAGQASTPGCPSEASDAQAPPLVLSNAIDHGAALTDATTAEQAQRAWDEIVRDTSLTSNERKKLYKQYMSVLKKFGKH